MKLTIKLLSALALVLSFATVASAVTVDTTKSTFKWTGKKKFIDSKHWGTIKLSKVEGVTVKKGNVTSGTFTMDMNTIDVTDLKGKKRNDFLGHVKTGDFFEVDKFPTATLKITGPAGKNKVKADLTIKGKTQPVTVAFTKKGKSYTGNLAVDRTKFGIDYGTEGFLKKIQKFASDRVIEKNFDIEFTVVTK